MTDDVSNPSGLVDELRATIAGLVHARHTLAAGSFDTANELWPRLDRCARRLAALDCDEREQMKSVMLAVLDELERAIAAFEAERRDLGDRLRSASRSLAAGAAYRQAGKG